MDYKTEFNNANAISFDVWGTLLTPNRIFGVKRNAYIADRFGIDIQLVSNVMSKTKDILNGIALQTGKAPSCDESYRLFLILLGEPITSTPGIRAKFETLFWEHPPILNADLVNTIRTLMTTTGKLYGLGSNTTFISGTNIIRFFEQNGLHFHFFVMSDMLRIAKPGYRFFERLVSEANTSKTIHIGNDPLFDICGAEDFGIPNILIDDPTDLNRVLMEMI